MEGETKNYRSSDSTSSERYLLPQTDFIECHHQQPNVGLDTLPKVEFKSCKLGVPLDSAAHGE